MHTLVAAIRLLVCASLSILTQTMYSDKPQNTIPLKHTASIVEVEIGRPEKREHDGEPQHSAALEISGAILKCCLPEASKPPPQVAVSYRGYHMVFEKKVSSFFISCKH